jgi:hypothetical protein
MRQWFTGARPRLATKIQSWFLEFRQSDDGDVPGWVMVTLMSALLVVAIFALAQTQLTAILSRALESVLP